MTFTPEDGSAPVEHHVAPYPSDGGLAIGMYNYTRSIEDFARASLTCRAIASPKDSARRAS